MLLRVQCSLQFLGPVLPAEFSHRQEKSSIVETGGTCNITWATMPRVFIHLAKLEHTSGKVLASSGAALSAAMMKCLDHGACRPVQATALASHQSAPVSKASTSKNTFPKGPTGSQAGVPTAQPARGMPKVPSLLFDMEVRLVYAALQQHIRPTSAACCRFVVSSTSNARSLHQIGAWYVGQSCIVCSIPHISVLRHGLLWPR